MTKALHNTLRKSATMFDNTINLDEVLNELQRKTILEKAIQDLIQDNIK